MAISRYTNRSKAINSKEQYKDTFEKRNVTFIEQHTTSNYENIDFSVIDRMGYKTHIWTSSDRAYRVANKYYGDPSLWWVIFRVNNIGSEADIEIGRELIIPNNLSIILTYLGD